MWRKKRWRGREGERESLRCVQWESSHAAHLSAHVSGGDTDVQSIGINTEWGIELNLHTHSHKCCQPWTDQTHNGHHIIATVHHTIVSAPASDSQPPHNVKSHTACGSLMTAAPVELSSRKCRGVGPALRLFFVIRNWAAGIYKRQWWMKEMMGDNEVKQCTKEPANNAFLAFCRFTGFTVCEVRVISGGRMTLFINQIQERCCLCIMNISQSLISTTSTHNCWLSRLDLHDRGGHLTAPLPPTLWLHNALQTWARGNSLRGKERKLWCN